jgi:Ca2+/Na+ antiporter
VASATLDGAPNLAVGGLFGSSAANILLMAIALAVVHGTRTRIRRPEPDAIAVLATRVVPLDAVWKPET